MKIAGKMRPKWESILTEITDNPDSPHEKVHLMGLHRLNVHGGWLVWKRNGGITFIPDPDHEWKWR